MRRTGMIIMTSLLISGCAGGPQEKPAEQAVSSVPYLFYTATDLHYLPPSLSGGEQFSRMLTNSDMKLTEYSDLILDAFIGTCISDHPKAVIFTGDLTFNGEKISHQILASKFRQLSDSGITPLVIPGNHDIDNPAARDWSGKTAARTDSVSRTEFEEIYHECGYDSALSKDPASLSYIYALDDEHWILMLDSARYEDNTNIYSEAGGRIRKKTIEWLEPWLKKAEAGHIDVISAMHHDLTDITGFPAYVISNAQEIRDLFAKYHVRVNLCGHTHLQYWKTINWKDESITDLMTGSLDVYSFRYGSVSWTANDSLTYTSLSTDVQGYAEKTDRSDSFVSAFDENSAFRFMQRSFQRSSSMFADQNLSDEDLELLRDVFKKQAMYLFDGRITEYTKLLSDARVSRIIKSLDARSRAILTGMSGRYTHDGCGPVTINMKKAGS